MITMLIISLPVLSQLFFWTGTYVKEREPWETTFDENSKLELKMDHTFTYNYTFNSTTSSCYLPGMGFSVNGKWETRNDTLILSSEIEIYNGLSVGSISVEKRFYHIESSQPITIQGKLQPKLIFIPMWKRNHDANTMLGSSWGNFKFDD